MVKSIIESEFGASNSASGIICVKATASMTPAEKLTKKTELRMVQFSRASTI